MTGKERALLRKAANGLDAVVFVGKDNLSGTLIEGARQALKARELIKVSVLEASELSAREVSAALADALGAAVVQVIGSKAVLYRCNPDIGRYGVPS